MRLIINKFKMNFVKFILGRGGGFKRKYNLYFYKFRSIVNDFLYYFFVNEII